MNREQRFFSYKNHAWYGRLFQRLTVDEVQLCLKFISNNEGRSCDQFCHDVNRMFLGVEKPPKNWTLIMELLTVTGQNSEGAGDAN